MIDEDTLDAYCAAAILGDCEIQEIAARVVVQKQVNLRFVKHKIWEATPEQERLRLVRTNWYIGAFSSCSASLTHPLSLLSRRSGSSPGGKR